MLALVIALPAGAAGVRESTKSGGAIRADLIYHNYCSVCHGDKGDGRSRAQNSLVPAPRDFTSPAAAQLPREHMIAMTRDGKPGTAMVGWKTQLNKPEIEAVVDYIRVTFMKADASAAMARGRQVYAETCSVCHGDRGQGAVWGAGMTRPPRAFTTAESKAELTRERMINSVTHGLPGTPMVSFASQLRKNDIEAVVDFIRTSLMQGVAASTISGTSAHGGRERDPQPQPHAQGQQQPAQAKAPAAPVQQVNMTVPMPNGLVGNAERGRKFYDANCATCHGVKGDAQGPRAYFIRPKPRNFLEPSARALLNRPALFAATANGSLGSEMPAWNKVIDDQKIADVAEYVFRAFIQPQEPTKVGARTK